MNYDDAFMDGYYSALDDMDDYSYEGYYDDYDYYDEYDPAYEEYMDGYYAAMEDAMHRAANRDPGKFYDKYHKNKSRKGHGTIHISGMDTGVHAVKEDNERDQARARYLNSTGYGTIVSDIHKNQPINENRKTEILRRRTALYKKNASLNDTQRRQKGMGPMGKSPKEQFEDFKKSRSGKNLNPDRISVAWSRKLFRPDVY